MPITVRCNHPTYLKKSKAPAADLPYDQKVAYTPGSAIVLSAYNPTDEQGHRLVTLAYEAGTWYLYSAHWDGLPVTPGSYAPSTVCPEGWSLSDQGYPMPPADCNDFKLPVPYFSQLDNNSTWQGPGYRQCRTSSLAMTVDYLTHGNLSSQAATAGLDADSYWGRLVAKAGYDTTEAQGHVLVAKALFNLNIPFSSSGDLNTIRSLLQQGVPVPLGMAYKSSGHWVTAVGIRGSSLYIHDPYGIRDGSSNQYTPNLDGSFDTYTQATLNTLWLDLGPHNGHCHLWQAKA